MPNNPNNNIIPIEIIEQKIYLIRDMKVMLGHDLAILYKVPLKRLNEQVKRNKKRFPKDFMFQLNKTESDLILSLRSQITTLKKRGGHIKYLPYAFTEQGVAMLASVLNSDRAIEASIAIIRVFVRLRELISTHKDLAHRLDELEQIYDEQFRVVFEAIRELMKPEPIPEKKTIGFGFAKEK